MATQQKPIFRSHQEEIDWHLAHRGGEIKSCACGNLTMGYTCHICEYEYGEISRYYGRVAKPDVLCSDCAPPCISCHKPVCELHARQSGECRECSGPTDAELAQ